MVLETDRRDPYGSDRVRGRLERNARKRRAVRSLARDAIARGEPLAWFEEVYQRAESSGVSTVPWADLRPNPNLVHWLERERIDGAGRRSLVVGCGLGDDAEELGRRGFAVTGFDISQSAIEMATTRFRDTDVEYLATDLFNAPASWASAYDFVHEAYTLQVLPTAMRREALRRMASFVAPKGILLLIARARDEAEDPGEMPWPLTRDEIKLPRQFNLKELSLEDYLDEEQPPVRRFRAVYRRLDR